MTKITSLVIPQVGLFAEKNKILLNVIGKTPDFILTVYMLHLTFPFQPQTATKFHPASCSLLPQQVDGAEKNEENINKNNDKIIRIYVTNSVHCNFSPLTD